MYCMRQRSVDTLKGLIAVTRGGQWRHDSGRGEIRFDQYPVNSSGCGCAGTCWSRMLDMIAVRVAASLSNPPCEVEVDFLSFLKISSRRTRAMKNQRIIRGDARDTPSAGNVRRRPVQVLTQARSRESVSPPSAQHRL